MIQDTLKKIEDLVRTSAQASPETKQELMRLMGELSSELATLERTHQQHAHSIAGFAEAATRQATTPSERPPSPEEDARAGLAASVREFETSHPRLTGLVRAISDALAGVGI
jgi:Mg2+ and Co2+ transporter CorA